MQNFMVYVDYRKLFIHLRSLKVHHFGMVGRDRKYGVKVILNGMTSLLNFMKNYSMVQKLSRGHTDRMVISQDSFLF
jgi:hypothetical protein